MEGIVLVFRNFEQFINVACRLEGRRHVDTEGRGFQVEGRAST